MDVAIQAKFDANQALKDSDALFQNLSKAQAVAVNIKLNPALAAQLSSIASSTSILGQAQGILNQQLTLTSTAAQLATAALARLAVQQAQLGQVTINNTTTTNAQSSSLNALAGRVLGIITAYVSLRSAMNLVREAMDARMEMDRLEIGMKAITQNAGEAAQATQFLQAETNRLGLDLRGTIPEFVKMMASLTSSGMSFNDAEKAFTNLSVATKAVGLSSAATGRILYDLQEMASMGTVQMRQLRMMLMQLPGALQAFSQAAGLSTAQFLEQVHKGMIDPTFIANQGLQALADKYSHEMPEALDTLESHTNRLKNSWMMLLAEMGKNPAIKGGVDTANKFLSDATIQAKLLNTPVNEYGLSFQSPSANDDQRKAALNKMFPSAKPYGQSSMDFANVTTGYTDLKSTPQPDWVNAYRRMQDQQSFYDKQKMQQGGGGSAAPQQLTEAQMDAFDKIEEIRKRTEIEALSGLQKEQAQIDINTQRQIDAIDKEQAKIKNLDGAQDAAARARLDIIIAGNQAKANARDADDAKTVQQYLDQVKTDSTDVSNIMRELIPDETERKIEDISNRFEQMRDHLMQIQDRSPNLLPAGWEQSLDDSKKKTIEDVKGKKSPVGFAGQDFNSLVSQRDDLKQSLLTQTDADQFQKTTQQIQEISQALVLQLHNDAASINQAFQFGFKETVDSWGSMSERMAKVGQTMADSMSTHMTDALTGLIEGTKSASQAFSEMALSIVSDLIRVAIQELVVKQIISAVGSISGLAGGAAGGETNGGTTSLDHFGGVAGAGGRSGSYSPHLFSNAPRFHTGGVMGDEIPIVARRGEVIFTPEQMKALSAAVKGGQGGQQKIEIANYTDARMIDAHLAKNPHLIVNAIMSQKKQVRRVLS